MIDRYTVPAMGDMWTDDAKFSAWLKVEVLAVEAWGELGRIPADAVEDVRSKAAFDCARVLEIEEEVRHDVIAFLTCMAEHIGPSSRFVHLGMTSSDILDTGLAIQMKDAAELLLQELDEVIEAVKTQAITHKDTVMIGRSHGIHAEPTTFGLKLLVWYHELLRAKERLSRAKDCVSVGQISGTVGTYANVDPFVEDYVCRKLGLTPAPASSQIIQRDRHAEFLSAIALVGASLDNFATEIRGLQRTEVGEVEEPFRKGQKGSSAMPHKRNPIVSERISGLSRVLRGNAVVGLENVALWHERDISHSSAERVVIPDSCITLHYMLTQFKRVMQGLVVNKDKMMANLELTHGLPFSGSVLLALIEKGISREDAYSYVQRCAMAAWESQKPLLDLLAKDSDVASLLTEEEIAECFDPRQPLKNVDIIFSRID